MKKLLKFMAILGLISTGALGAASYLQGQAGLDTNSEDNFDPTLETLSDEEKYFDDVASFISGFVKTQYQIRQEISDVMSKPWFERQFLLSDKKEKKYKKILEDLPNEGKYASRDVHRKTHGCYEASLKIDDEIKEKINKDISQTIQERSHSSTYGTNLIPELIEDKESLGVFRPGAEYKALVRLSNGHPGNRHDRLPDARGFAVKILPKTLDLQKNNALEVNKNTLLDILTINFPTFFVNGATKYMVINKWFLKSAEDDQGILGKLYEGFSVFGPDWLGGAGLTELEKKLALKTNGSIIAHPLYEEYFSMVPSRLGKRGEARAVKYVWVPSSCSPEDTGPEHENFYSPKWTETHNYSYPSKGLPVIKPNIPPFEGSESYWNHYYLRDRVENTLKKNGFCYELQVQLYRDQQSTNIEDSKDIWLSSEKERKSWMESVVSELKDDNLRKWYRKKIQRKKIAPRIKIAKLRFNQLKRSEKASNSKFCEDLSFNPWHGNIQYHKPLGQISRMKQKVYNAVRRHRHQINGINSSELERE